jgi:hypothetical protein
LAQPHRIDCRIRSIYGGAYIADDIPIVSGDLTADDGQAVPERLTIEVPVRDAGTAWEPRDPGDPLNNFGQRLEVAAYIIPRSAMANIEVPLGQFRIQDWHAGRDSVRVEAVGLLKVVEEARLTVPASPLSGQTYTEAIEWLMDDLLPIEFAAGLPADVEVSQVVQWDEDRLGAIFDLLDAWGARGRVNAEGVFLIEPYTMSTEPVVTWRDGERGTVVSAPRSGSRDGIFNAVIARSSSQELEEYEKMIAQAAVFDMRPESPVAWNGPFGRVPYFHTSPLIQSAKQAEQTAATILQRLTRWATTRVVTAMPDPRPELGDIGRIVTQEHAGPTDLTGEVVGYRLPLTAAQGAAQYTVSTMGVVG